MKHRQLKRMVTIEELKVLLQSFDHEDKHDGCNGYVVESFEQADRIIAKVKRYIDAKNADKAGGE